MTKLEFIEWFKDYKSNTGIWIVEHSISIDTPFTIGCFENQDNEYIVYINYEQERLIVYQGISETTAYSTLYEIVLGEIENNL